MAKQHDSGLTGRDVPPDTDSHAHVDGVGKIGDRRDTNLIPGVGIMLSRSRVDDMGRAAALAQSDGKKVYLDEKAPGRLLLSEAAILHWAREILKQQDMTARNPKRGGRPGYDETCYPGTDTMDPTKDPTGSGNRDSANKYWIDKSRSTILISTSSGDYHLNGSAVRHTHTIHIELTTPDGRHYGDFNMSMDQFAAALVSNMQVPITWESFWDINNENVKLTEVVHPPATIKDRMEQRLWDRLDDVNEWGDKVIGMLKAAQESGKPMGKQAQAEMLKNVETLMGHLKANANFVVDQALEETSAIVEKGAITVMAMLERAAGAPQGQMSSSLIDLLGSSTKEVKQLPVVVIKGSSVIDGGPGRGPRVTTRQEIKDHEELAGDGR